MAIFYNPNRKKGLFYMPSGATGGDRLAIQYSAARFCEDGIDPIPGITGDTGGTFSSTTGLVFISTSTGQVDLSASTPGSYVVTYTAPSSDTATTSISIDVRDNAGFSYSASSYEPTDADPTPTITGLTGGTFSGTTGLVINSTTGEIDLSASTVASHTITYDTTSSGSSVCPNTSTQTVEIAVAGIANNYSMNFDSASSDYIDTNTTLDSSYSSLTLSAWVNYTSISDYSGTIFGQWIQNNNSGSTIICYTVSNKIQVYLGPSATSLTSTTTLTTGTWYNVILRFDGSTMKLYINGTEEDSISFTSINNSAQNLILGAYSNSTQTGYQAFLNGKIDEVAIWNTALTSTQVSEIYNAKGTNLTKDLTTVSGGPVYWNRMGD